MICPCWRCYERRWGLWCPADLPGVVVARIDGDSVASFRSIADARAFIRERLPEPPRRSSCCWNALRMTAHAIALARAGGAF